MKLLPDWLQDGYRKLISPVADFLVARRVSPNIITAIGTAFWVLGGVLYGAGNIRTAGWLLGITALFDVLDGQVARASGRSTAFGAFLDSTLDRVADGAVMGGLAYFFASSQTHHSPAMVAVCSAGLLGSLLISYTRARADGIGVHVKVGTMQRPERVVLLTAPQAFFGLALNGLVLMTIVVVLTLSAWLTVMQRIVAVYRATRVSPAGGVHTDAQALSPTRAHVDAPSPILKGD